MITVIGVSLSCSSEKIRNGRESPRKFISFVLLKREKNMVHCHKTSTHNLLYFMYLLQSWVRREWERRKIRDEGTRDRGGEGIGVSCRDEPSSLESLGLGQGYRSSLVT